LVLDELCDHQSIDIRSGLFGEAKGACHSARTASWQRSTSAQKSAVAAAAEAFRKVPESVASSLETASKIADAVDKIRVRPSERAIARVTKQVELKQKELELSGLAATEADYAELLRLTQEAELLEKRKEIAGYSPAAPSGVDREIAALKQEIELLKLRQQAERWRVLASAATADD